MTTRYFQIGDKVSIVSDNSPPQADEPCEGTIVGFKNYGFIVVQLARDVQGEYKYHELTLIEP